jgi:hypothetical protein
MLVYHEVWSCLSYCGCCAHDDHWTSEILRRTHSCASGNMQTVSGMYRWHLKWSVLHLTRSPLLCQINLQLKNSIIQTTPAVGLSFLCYRCYKFQQLVHPVCTAAIAMCLLAALICKGVRLLCHVNCVQLHITTGVCDKCAKCQ